MNRRTHGANPSRIDRQSPFDTPAQKQRLFKHVGSAPIRVDVGRPAHAGEPAQIPIYQRKGGKNPKSNESGSRPAAGNENGGPPFGLETPPEPDPAEEKGRTNEVNQQEPGGEGAPVLQELFSRL
jgi:hypothetical protein